MVISEVVTIRGQISAGRYPNCTGDPICPFRIGWQRTMSSLSGTALTWSTANIVALNGEQVRPSVCPMPKQSCVRTTAQLPLMRIMEVGPRPQVLPRLHSSVLVLQRTVRPMNSKPITVFCTHPRWNDIIARVYNVFGDFNFKLWTLIMIRRE